MRYRKVLLCLTVFCTVAFLGSMFDGYIPHSNAGSITQQQIDNAHPPVSPEDIVGLPPMSVIMSSNDATLDRIIERNDAQLIFDAQQEGRELRDDEYITVVKRRLLRPHASSPVNDVLIDAYVLSNGSEGHFFASPVFSADVKGPFRYRVEELNLDEGWYIVHLLTAEEMQAEDKLQEQQKEEAEQVGFLDLFWNALGYLGPSSAYAGGPWTHSILVTVKDKSSPFTKHVEEGVKMTWESNSSNPLAFPLVNSKDKRCVTFGSWVAAFGCGSIAETQQILTYPLGGTKKVARTTTYKPLVTGSENVTIDESVYGYNLGIWFTLDNCDFTNLLGVAAKCEIDIDAF